MVVPTFLSLQEAASWLSKETHMTVKIDWVLQHASEGRIPIFGLLRKAFLLEVNGGKEGSVLYNRGDRIPLGPEWARQMLGQNPDEDPAITIHVYKAAETGIGHIEDIHSGDRSSIEIQRKDICVRSVDLGKLNRRGTAL